MPSSIVNLPAIDVWVRKEYLRDHVDGHGEFVKGIWVTAKSIPGRAFILKLTFLIMVLCMTSYLFLHSFLTHLLPRQIWIFTIFSFGTVWIMGWLLFVKTL